MRLPDRLGAPKLQKSIRRSSLTQSQEDYLKALYQLRRANRSVTTSELAERLAVSAASATEMLGKLAAVGLVDHDRYRGASLTVPGHNPACPICRSDATVHFAVVDGYRLVRCRECRHLFLIGGVSEAFLANAYGAEYYGQGDRGSERLG